MGFNFLRVPIARTLFTGISNPLIITAISDFIIKRPE
jgi:hypothetical protein